MIYLIYKKLKMLDRLLIDSFLDIFGSSLFEPKYLGGYYKW